VVSSTPRPHFTPGKDPVPILQKAGWAPGPVWTGGNSRPHRDSIPDRPARNRSLYRLSYPAHFILRHKTVKCNRFCAGLLATCLPANMNFEAQYFHLRIAMEPSETPQRSLALIHAFYSNQVYTLVSLCNTYLP